MNITKFRLVFIACGTLVVFVAGVFAGGVYASTIALRGANASSLVYFTGIHDAINHQNYEKASRITDTAVDGHIGVLRQLKSWPWAIPAVMPLGHTQATWISSVALDRVRKSYEGQSGKLQPETRNFLAASQ